MQLVRRQLLASWQDRRVLDLPAGGWGGTPYANNMRRHHGPLGNCMNMPAETAGSNNPIAYEAFELRRDSAGPGQHRGGLGAVFRCASWAAAGWAWRPRARTLEGNPGAAG